MIEIADSAVRERALEPDQSFIVGAPAGSGKTTLLTQRFLRLLSLTEQPESIVAVTFTRKAAEEMRSRVLAALRAARDGGDDLDPVSRHWANIALEADNANDWRLLDNPRRLRMQTIDSLAAAIARRGPLLSGFAGDVGVLDDPRPLYDQAARATIAALGGSDTWTRPVETLLAHFDNNWERLERMLAEMLARRDQWLRFVVRQPERRAFEQALSRTVAAQLRSCCAQLPRSCATEIVELAAFGGGNLATRRPDDDRAGLASLGALPAAEVDALPQWRALAQVLLTGGGTWRRKLTVNDGFPPDAAEQKDRFFAVIDELRESRGVLEALQQIRALPDPAYTDADWTCLDALFDVLKLAAAQLQLEFNQGGAIDFAGINQAALAALGGLQTPSELQLALDYQVQHLLIDEFQDTSIAQFELIERLVDGWTEGDGRSLFLVGDPMQSIYRFREADVSLFVDTAAAGRFASIPLETLQLTTNFRAQAGLIDWLNDAVAILGEEPQAPYRALPKLVAARARADHAAVAVHGVIADAPGPEMQTVVELVSASLAEHPDRRIGILVRSRTHLGSLGEKLLAAGIAVVASDIDQLAAQPIVLDLVALTRALLHPDDRTAWLAMLRAPWCGLRLGDLTEVFERARETPVVDRLREAAVDGTLDEDARRRVSALLAVTDRFEPLRGRTSISELVEATWLALDGPSCYDSSALRHAERYFYLLAINQDRIDVLSPRRLDELLAKEYVAPPPQSDAQVEIMTIHAAKGLEFDVVVLPGLGRIPRSESRRLLEWRAHLNEDGVELLFAPIESAGAVKAPINEFLRAADKRESEAEVYRLLYVAMTRAREMLHLVGTVKRADDDAIEQPSGGSFFRMLWPAVGAQLKSAEGAAGTTLPREPAHQQLRRLAVPAGSTVLPPMRDEAAPLSGRLAVEFSWASPIAKHIGTVTHALLQRVSDEGLDRWPPARITELAPVIEQRLRGAGVDPRDTIAARERIIEALTHALNSSRGRWILGGEHGDRHSEYALTAMAHRRPVNIVIDRTFVDAEDRRWIIDFKTGVHAGGSPEAFVASEVERYRPQLDRYAALLRQRETREIRLGLFFPLLDEWREWAFDERRAARD